MPRTRVLQPLTNIPSTPRGKAEHFKAALEKKESENEELKSNIADLTKALNDLTLVKKMAIAPDNPFNKVAMNKDGKQKKRKMDSDVPKPAMTAYRFYINEVKGTMKDENPKMTAAELSSAIRQQWKESKDEEKKKFVNMAAEDRKRFKEENDVYKRRVADRESEDKALELYYEKQKHDFAVEFYEAHAAAQGLLRKKKNKRDPEAPRRAMSSYLFFALEKRDQVVAENPGKSVAEISKILGEQWSKLEKGKAGKNGTKKYDIMAAKDRARYEKEKKEYDLKARKEQEMQLQKDKEEAMKMLKETESTEGGDTANSDFGRKKKRDPDAPKRARSSYLFFTMEKRDQVVAENPGKSVVEISKILGEQWGKLEKGKEGKNGTKKYDIMAAKDRARYEKEKEEYDRLKASRNLAAKKEQKIHLQGGEAMNLPKKTEQVRAEIAAVFEAEEPKAAHKPRRGGTKASKKLDIKEVLENQKEDKKPAASTKPKRLKKPTTEKPPKSNSNVSAAHAKGGRRAKAPGVRVVHSKRQH